MACCGNDGDGAANWGGGCFKSSPSLIDRFKVPFALPDFLKTGTLMKLELDEELPPSVDVAAGILSAPLSSLPSFSVVALAGALSPDNGMVHEPTFLLPNVPWSYRSITRTAFPSSTRRSSAMSFRVAFHVGFKLPFLSIGEETFMLG